MVLKAKVAIELADELAESPTWRASCRCLPPSHLGVGVDVPEHQTGVVLPEPAHLGVQPCQLGALSARNVPQPLQIEKRE